MQSGEILAGFLAPHPQHLVYGENPQQNEALAAQAVNAARAQNKCAAVIGISSAVVEFVLR